MNVHGVDKIIGTDQYHITAECSYSSKVASSSEGCSNISRAADVPNEKASRSALSD